jgi:hypothetical protein
MLDNLTSNLKSLASLTLQVSWENWNEPNTRVFHKKHTTSVVLLGKRKESHVLGYSSCQAVE